MAPPRSRSGARRRGYKYDLLNSDGFNQLNQSKKARTIAVVVLVSLIFAGVVVISWAMHDMSNKSCDSIENGYHCNPKISQFFGQYSSYYSVPTDISNELPDGCSITFAQVLSRHGARDPSSSKSTAYRETIEKLKANVKEYEGKYAFLANYEYTLGADLLTDFGRQQMYNSGSKFYKRYKLLADENAPFIRTSGQTRVIESAEKWAEGYRSRNPQQRAPKIRVIISEEEGSNNTLSAGLCKEFEDGETSTIGSDTKRVWADVFLPPIQKRLNADLPGADFTLDNTLHMMELCPFVTVAHPLGHLSEFCNLFTAKEWHQYDYYQSLDKWYGHGNGNPLGPTQGVGWVNELIARLTARGVEDHTSVNHTLDSNNWTFPLNRVLYADFSHDNDMAGIFAALGLYRKTEDLSNKIIQDTSETNGYSASWSVPFAARTYVEKMRCPRNGSELVRVVVNDRVVPLQACKADRLGRCQLHKWIDSLSFAREGGKWDQCAMKEEEPEPQPEGKKEGDKGGEKEKPKDHGKS